MDIDLNNLSRIAYYREYNGANRPESFGIRDNDTEDLLFSLDDVIEDLENYNRSSHTEFSKSYIELLQKVLSIAHLKNIDLNRYIRMSIPVDKKVIEYC